MPSWLPARAQVGAAMASCWHETKGMAGRPASLVHHSGSNEA